MTDNIEFNVVYGPPSPEELSKKDNADLVWGTRVDSHYFKVWETQLVYQKIRASLVQAHEMIIVPHENSFLLNHYCLLNHIRKGTIIALFGHGANFQSADSRGLREKLKAWTARQADWWFAYTELSRKRVVESGFPNDRITCVNNAIDITKFVEWKSSLRDDEVAALRTALGIRGHMVGVFIGSLYKEKRLHFLFEACDELRGRMPSFEIVIIGDGPLRDETRSYAKTRPWAHWVGAKHGREKVIHLSLANVMLNPGMVGLNILDSFALGIPLVTTDCGIHSPEIAYLRSEQNGLMTSNDVGSFASGIRGLFENKGRRDAFAAAGKEDAEKYSLDRMVQNFADGIINAMNSEQLGNKR